MHPHSSLRPATLAFWRGCLHAAMPFRPCVPVSSEQSIPTPSGCSLSFFLSSHLQCNPVAAFCPFLARLLAKNLLPAALLTFLRWWKTGPENVCIGEGRQAGQGVGFGMQRHIWQGITLVERAGQNEGCWQHIMTGHGDRWAGLGDEYNRRGIAQGWTANRQSRRGNRGRATAAAGVATRGRGQRGARRDGAFGRKRHGFVWCKISKGECQQCAR